MTERKKAEANLKRSEKLLNETQKIAKVGGWEIDLVQHAIFWTDEIYCIHEVPLDFNPTFENAKTFYTPEDLPIITEAIENAIQKGTPFDLELQIITAKGKRLNVRVQGESIKENGKIVKVTGTIHEITERKRAEEQRENLIKDLQEALDRVKTLSGLLPICAECKKIRDDKGYWNQIEVYVRDHSEAEFSHGICPECMDKLYGDQEWYKK
ncbi:MAG: PAS domain-containing protein [Bacteroidetes bacterium]|nr:PAS domain-containing protein [Bacteroidota bacterium]